MRMTRVCIVALIMTVKMERAILTYDYLSGNRPLIPHNNYAHKDVQMGPTKTAPLLNKHYWNEGNLNGDEIH